MCFLMAVENKKINIYIIYKIFLQHMKVLLCFDNQNVQIFIKTKELCFLKKTEPKWENTHA